MFILGLWMFAAIDRYVHFTHDRADESKDQMLHLR